MNVLCTLALDKHFVAVAVAVCHEPLSETEISYMCLLCIWQKKVLNLNHYSANARNLICMACTRICVHFITI